METVFVVHVQAREIGRRHMMVHIEGHGVLSGSKVQRTYHVPLELWEKILLCSSGRSCEGSGSREIPGTRCYWQLAVDSHCTEILVVVLSALVYKLSKRSKRSYFVFQDQPASTVAHEQGY
jgi:hypothetical protein